MGCHHTGGIPFFIEKIGKIYRELLTFIISRDIIKTVKEDLNH